MNATLTPLMAAAAQNPVVLLIAVLCIFAAGALAGLAAKQRPHNESDAGDTQADMVPLSPMRTANPSLIDLQTRRIQQQAGAHPKARAGRSHLKPSYPPARDDAQA